MKQHNLTITFGKIGQSRTFDTEAFNKQWKNIQQECMFKAVYDILLRDYVGKGIAKDIHKRLRDCRQVSYDNGRYRVKTATEQHADFMRLVQEFDAEQVIPANLPNIAFHNLSTELQQELVNMDYTPPSVCDSNEEQYRMLAELQAKMIEAENKITQMTNLIRRVGGNRTTLPASAFLTTATPNPVTENWLTTHNEYGQYHDPSETIEVLEQEANHFRTMLSVAETAMRQASGEPAPLECWGCKGIPEYEESKFHRYRACPNRSDPKVRNNYEKNLKDNLQALADKRRSYNQFRPRNNNNYYRRQPPGSPSPNKMPRTMVTTNEYENTPEDGTTPDGSPTDKTPTNPEDCLQHEFGISETATDNHSLLFRTNVAIIRTPSPEHAHGRNNPLCHGATTQYPNVTTDTPSPDHATTPSNKQSFDKHNNNIPTYYTITPTPYDNEKTEKTTSYTTTPTFLINEKSEKSTYYTTTSTSEETSSKDPEDPKLNKSSEQEASSEHDKLPIPPTEQNDPITAIGGSNKSHYAIQDNKSHYAIQDIHQEVLQAATALTTLKYDATPLVHTKNGRKMIPISDKPAELSHPKTRSTLSYGSDAAHENHKQHMDEKEHPRTVKHPKQQTGSQ